MNRHYDIGIVGCWYWGNYGSILNGYATFSLLKSFGLSPLNIVTPHNGFEDHAKRFFKTAYCNDDISELLPFERVKEFNEICGQFLTGSDQIWHYAPNVANKDFAWYFKLNFTDDNKKRTSFATSFGKYNPEPVEERIGTQRLFKRYSAISVREDESVKILSDDYGIKATRVLEPVFDVTRDIWDSLAEKSDYHLVEPCLLTYILDPTPEKRNAIKYYANKLGLKTVNILDGFSGSYNANKARLDLPGTLPNISANDFLKHFQNAKFVITDSFHGACFSLIYNVPFIAISNFSRGIERFKTLLNSVGMSGRLVNDVDIPLDDGLIAPVNFFEANAVIESQRNFAVDWLRHAVESPKDQLESVSIPSFRYPGMSRPIERSVTEKLNPALCSGCSNCYSICPVGAITMIKNSEGFLNPSVDPEKCTNCGLCSERCTVLNPRYNNSLSECKCYAVMADEETRMKSSSGGMFSIAAEYVIDKGGYVCGAAFNEDFSVSHKIIDKKSDIALLRGSKYLQSDLKDSFKRIKQLLSDGNVVLFTGLPCQVAGLHSFLGKEYDNLYTMELLCHGITSYKVFAKYLSDVHKDKPLKAIGFKEKEPWGWHAGINAYFTDGSKYAQPLETDPYYQAYLHSISKNTACGHCKFNCLPRQGDFTIGDFWSISRYDKEMFDGKGTSIVLANNEKAKKVFMDMTPYMEKYKEETMDAAKASNPCVTAPYPLHKNRSFFFGYFDALPFEDLTDGCKGSSLYEKINKEVSKTVPESDVELYMIAEKAVRLSNGRKIVTWIRSEQFEEILLKYFGKRVSFGVAVRDEMLQSGYIEKFESLNGRSGEYFLVSFDQYYDNKWYETLRTYGYTENKDFIFRRPKPIVLTNLDLNKGNYFDEYGNTIEGSGGIGKVVMYGWNNHIVISGKVAGTDKLNISMSHNGYIFIGEQCSFNRELKIELNYDGSFPVPYAETATLRIGRNCRFDNGLIRIFGDENHPRVLIGDYSSFQHELDIHANQGKKIVIGRDCMFSNNVSIWAGDGHTIFSSKSGKVKNITFPGRQTVDKDIVSLGNHVWVGKGAMLLCGTRVGDGSIIAAKCTVSRAFPNNCSIGGNPAKVLSTDIAWSRQLRTSSIETSVNPEYVDLTRSSNSSLSGRNILVAGGTRFLGIELVNELIERGNTVTIATRGITKDYFGLKVKRIYMDISDFESVKKALSGKYFDVVFDQLSYCSLYTHNLLSNVRCGKYIQLSSVAVYGADMRLNTAENVFSPSSVKANISDISEDYVSGKRNSEAIAYQKFSHIPMVTVRIPYIAHFYQLYYYCESIVDGTPMSIANPLRRISFTRPSDVGKFLTWIASQDFTGIINFSSEGHVSIGEIVSHIETKTGIKAVIDNINGKPEPFNPLDVLDISLDLSNAKKLDYRLSNIDDWFWTLLDEFVDYALKHKRTAQ